jgi:indole-3-glycerol phosphate synthase
LLETHTEEEFLLALETEADLIGINNRNLKNMEVDLEATKNILARHRIRERVIVSESGVQSPGDIRFLHNCGAHGFLVGSSIMKASDIEEKVRELATKT